ncbi:hypothetical protein [Variovorax paradoxus]|uniref:hypothetical protein n=1 Tax=Variovorax paradoxus TaxID=34073 RepID=UPI001ABD46A8
MASKIDVYVASMARKGSCVEDPGTTVASTLRSEHGACLAAAKAARAHGASHALLMAQAKAARFYFAAYQRLGV